MEQSPESCAGINVSLDDGIELLEAINFFAGMGNDELIHWSKCAHDYAVKAIDVEKTEGMRGCMKLTSMTLKPLLY